MSSSKSSRAKTIDKPPVLRKAGRPPAAASGKIDKASIIDIALELAKTVPLQDLSIVMVAKTMNVTPALLHYYLGGRDALTSGVMNAFYKTLLDVWPARRDEVSASIMAMARSVYDHFVLYAGVASYTLLNNRFRIFQLVDEGETDYGILMLERFTEEVVQAGWSAERTGIYAHMLLDYVISSAHHRVAHRYPGEHRGFLKAHTDRLDPVKFPSIAYTREAIVNLNAEAAFEEGCRLFIAGLRDQMALSQRAG